MLFWFPPLESSASDEAKINIFQAITGYNCLSGVPECEVLNCLSDLPGAFFFFLCEAFNNRLMTCVLLRWLGFCGSCFTESAQQCAVILNRDRCVCVHLRVHVHARVCVCVRWGRWRGLTRHVDCCGWWRKRPCSPGALRKPCWSAFLATTAPRRERSKVSIMLHTYPSTWATEFLQNALQIHVAGLFLCTFSNPDLFSDPGPNLLLKSEKQHHFLLGHSHGTDWVEYDVLGWLCHAKQNPASQNAVTLLQDSQK